MKWFELLDDTSSNDRWHLGQVTTPEGVEWDFGKTKRYGGNVPVLAEYTNPGRPLDFCYTSFAVPVVTKELGSLILSIAAQDVQCVPLHVAGHGQRMLLNVLQAVDCVDEGRSQFMKWTLEDHRPDLAGTYRQITPLIIDPVAVPAGVQIFRVQKYEIAVIVSARLREAIEGRGFSGAVFRDVNP